MQHDPSNALNVIANAIQAKRVIVATYNGAKIELCPHEIFVRDQALYLRAGLSP